MLEDLQTRHSHGEGGMLYESLMEPSAVEGGVGSSRARVGAGVARSLSADRIALRGLSLARLVSCVA
jgi:hypothetical protein